MIVTWDLQLRFARNPRGRRQLSDRGSQHFLQISLSRGALGRETRAQPRPPGRIPSRDLRFSVGRGFRDHAPGSSSSWAEPHSGPLLQLPVVRRPSPSYRDCNVWNRTTRLGYLPLGSWDARNCPRDRPLPVRTLRRHATPAAEPTTSGERPVWPVGGFARCDSAALGLWTWSWSLSPGLDRVDSRCRLCAHDARSALSTGLQARRLPDGSRSPITSWTQRRYTGASTSRAPRGASLTPHRSAENADCQRPDSLGATSRREVRLEPSRQHAAPAVQPTHHRTDGHGEGVRGFLVRVVAEVDQQEHLPKRLGQ